MKHIKLLCLIFLSLLIILPAGCGDDDPVKPNDDDPDDSYPPGLVWSDGQDWPLLVAPENGQDVIIGDDLPRFTARYTEGFSPLLNAARGGWYIKITRPEALCDAWSTWDLRGYSFWSNDLPRTDWHFNFNWSCMVHNSTLSNWDVSWPMTEPFRFTIMKNGQWVEEHKFENRTFNYGGNGYKIERTVYMPSHPPLYLSMVRTWVQGTGADGDRTFVEGERKVTHRIVSGVALSKTETFTETVGWSAGIDCKGICAGLNQTFETQTSHTVSFDSEVEHTEESWYDVPAGEQWRYIQLYGVERYTFTDATGNPWSSPQLNTKNLGTIDNQVRNVLMIVKYREGSTTPYAADFLSVEPERVVADAPVSVQ